MTDISSRVRDLTPRLVATRRDLHQHPEIAFEEVRTAGIVAERLRELGLEPRTGLGKTGVVAVWDSGRPGPTVLARADMDALPVPEEKSVEYRSTVLGKMHACGHDGHTSVLLAVAEVVTGMAEACEAAGCALLGGETAEMPGVYMPGAFDIAGCLVGLAERKALLPRGDVAAGDALIGIASSGPHTNGYSFLRRLFDWMPMDATPPGFDRTLGEALLEPHRSYLPVLDPAFATGHVKALAHITGGGLPENLPRVLPDGVDAEIALGSWPRGALFDLIAELTTGVEPYELHRMLNMGIGMVAVVADEHVAEVQAAIPEPTWLIGRLVGGQPGSRTVHLL